MILRGLTMIGEKTIDGTLSATEQSTYLYVLNSMMDSWSIDRSLIYTILQENFPLTAGTISYTIGSGGTFNTTRPEEIVNAFIRDSASYDRDLDIIPQAQYASIKVKSIGNTYPEALYYDAAYVGAGLATIYIYPPPVASLTLYINSTKQLQSFASVTTALSLPPGYQRAIEANFAIEAAPGLTSVSPEVLKIAKESLAAIKKINVPDSISRLDSGLAGSRRGNIISGP